MVSLMNGLSAMGGAVSSFAGTAGLEAQKADLAQQGMVLADQLAHTSKTAEIAQGASLAATAAEASHGYALSEQAPRLATELQAATLSSQATLGAAGIQAAAQKYAADVQSKGVYAEIAALDPTRAAAVSAQNEQTLAAHIQNQNATDLQGAHAALVAETGKANPDPAVISTLTNKITAYEASAGQQASIITARTAIYHTDLENVQQLNTRISAATAQLNSPEMEEGSKAALRANIEDLKSQLVGAQLSLQYSSATAHGAIAAATNTAPPGTGTGAPATGRPSLSSILTPPGGGGKAAAAPAPAASTAAAASAPAAPSSGPSNTPPALLQPISATGTAFARQQISVMDQIDAGKKVTSGADVLDYANKSPAQRAAIRAGIEKSIAGAATAAPTAPGISLNNTPPGR